MPNQTETPPPPLTPRDRAILAQLDLFLHCGFHLADPRLAIAELTGMVRRLAGEPDGERVQSEEPCRRSSHLNR